MIVKEFVCAPIDNNCFVIHKEDGQECMVVDPSWANEAYSYISEAGLTLTHILLTHGHFDHLGGVAKLKANTNAKIAIHTSEAEALFDDNMSLAVIAGTSIEPSKADILLDGGEIIANSEFEVKVIHTPGHSPGSVCYLIEGENIMFSGDTVFRLSFGRVDLPGGDMDELYASITGKLFELKENYEIMPGHMRKTTLEFEKKHNPILRVK